MCCPILVVLCHTLVAFLGDAIVWRHAALQPPPSPSSCRYKNWLEVDKPVLDPCQDIPKGTHSVKVFFAFK